MVLLQNGPLRKKGQQKIIVFPVLYMPIYIYVDLTATFSRLKYHTMH